MAKAMKFGVIFGVVAALVFIFALIRLLF